MIRHLIFILLITFFYSCNVNKHTSKSNVFDDNSFLEELFEEFPVGAQIAIGYIENDSTIFKGFIKNNTKIDTINNENGIFEIGSISKVFTSFLLSKSIETNKLSLNDKVQTFFEFELNKGDLGFNPNEITLLQLSNHTSGLPRVPIDLVFGVDIDRTNPYANYDSIKLEAHLKTNFYRQSKPGEKYAYSNLGAGLLGYILEKVYNKSYENLLNKNIFNSLKMTSSSIYVRDSSRLIKGLDNNGIVNNWEFKSLAGAGGIKSTVNDMSLFIKYNIETSDREYVQMREKTFSVNKDMEMGLGWHILKRNDKELLFHNGATGGYTSSLVIDIKNKKGIIILCNISPNITLGSLDELSLKWIGQK